MTVVDSIAVARRMIEQRACRREFFGQAADGFREPAWDVLLELFVRSEGGALPVTAVDLERVVGDPQQEGVFVRFLGSHRLLKVTETGVVMLEPKGRDAMHAYLEAQAGRGA